MAMSSERGEESVNYLPRSMKQASNTKIANIEVQLNFPILSGARVLSLIHPVTLIMHGSVHFLSVKLSFVQSNHLNRLQISLRSPRARAEKGVAIIIVVSNLIILLPFKEMPFKQNMQTVSLQ